MFAMNFMLRWSWFLGMALILPIALPAGGAELYLHECEIRFLKKSEFLCCEDKCFLKASPFSIAPTLRSLQIGTSLRILRSLKTNDNNVWVQVQINSYELLGSASAARRGWVNV